MKIKIRKIIFTIVVLFSIILNSIPVEADVGSFESYHSGSSGSSRSSSWESSRNSLSSSDYDDSDMDEPLGVIFIILIIIAYVLINKNAYNIKKPLHKKAGNIVPNPEREKQVENQIKQVDPMFNKEEFIANTKSLFVKLQQAWTDRDWSVIRVFETNELFEQHKNQLQGYINNNQINVIDRICVDSAYLYSFERNENIDILTVILNSRMIDYVIDATTKQILKGDKTTERINTYILTFIRRNVLQTKQGSERMVTTNCPNCGAPAQIISAGKCEYCGSTIKTEEYSWVLSNLERKMI